ncbi:MAG: hypothetical protein OEZ57_16060, partial [Nitrospirota bacterium]|nr:hypothetical protein [Nitrospirota bacterium]
LRRRQGTPLAAFFNSPCVLLLTPHYLLHTKEISPSFSLVFQLGRFFTASNDPSLCQENDEMGSS